MASEINVNLSLSVRKNSVGVSDSLSGTIDMSGTEMLSSVQTFSTSDSQTVSIGGCDSVGAILIHNMDSSATLTVSVNATHTQVISVIPAGKGIILYGTSTTIYAKSSAGSIEAFITVCES